MNFLFDSPGAIVITSTRLAGEERAATATPRGRNKQIIMRAGGGVDRLKLGTNAGFLKRIKPEQVVTFSSDCVKINHRGKRQQRSIAMTSVALYTLKPGMAKSGKFQKRVPLEMIRDAYRTEELPTEVLVRVDGENDIHLELDAAGEFIDMLRAGMIEAGHIAQDAHFGIELQREVVHSLKDDVAAGAKQKTRKSVVGRLMGRATLATLQAQSDGGRRSSRALGLPRGSSPSALATLAEGAGSIGATIQKVARSSAPCRALNLDSSKLADSTYATQAFCEVMCTPGAREGMLSHLGGLPDVSSDVAGECVVILRADDVEARRWAVKDLGMLVRLFDTKKLRDGKGACRDGFVPLVKAQLMTQPHLHCEVYTALLEVALDIIIRPSEQSWMGDVLDDDGKPKKPREVEPFGKQLVRPEVLGLLLELSAGLETASESPDLPFLVRVLKDVNVLLVMKKGNNFSGILKHSNWCSWLLPFCTVVYAASDARKADSTDVQKNLHKYLINSFALILFHVFEEEQSINTVLRGVLDDVALFSGWGSDAIGLSQILFNGLLTKIVARSRMWKNDFGAKQWPSLFLVLDVVEDFFFYCPLAVAFDASSVGEPKLLSAASSRGGGQRTSKNGGIGLHLNPATGKCMDLKLAKAAKSALKQLSIKGGDNIPPGTSRKEKEICKTANEYFDFFCSVIDLLTEINATAGDKAAASTVLTKVSVFLSKRSRKKRGFLTAGKTKQQISKALEVSMMRQQAQVLVRKKRPPPKAIVTKAAVVATTPSGGSSADAAAVTRVSQLVVTARSAVSSRAGAAASKSASTAGEEGEVDASGGAFSDALCAQCGKGDLTEENAINAMGQWWHRNHFVCHACHEPLCKAGSADVEYIPGAEDGKPYCKRDFLKLFAPATCQGCLEPFKAGESMVEACGGQWHPEHLVCLTCHSVITSVDDDMTTPTCGDCLAAEELTCAGCQGTIGESEDGMLALGRPWHRMHFKCAEEKCETVLSASFYSHDAEDGRGLLPYCEDHFMQNFVEKCPACLEPVTTGGVVACGRTWHSGCFGCRNPGGCTNPPFGDDGFMEEHGEPYCTEHFYELFGERCAGCDQVLVGPSLSAMNKKFREYISPNSRCCFSPPASLLSLPLPLPLYIPRCVCAAMHGSHAGQSINQPLLPPQTRTASCARRAAGRSKAVATRSRRQTQRRKIRSQNA